MEYNLRSGQEKSQSNGLRHWYPLTILYAKETLRLRGQQAWYHMCVTVTLEVNQDLPLPEDEDNKIAKDSIGSLLNVANENTTYPTMYRSVTDSAWLYFSTTSFQLAGRLAISWYASTLLQKIHRVFTGSLPTIWANPTAVHLAIARIEKYI